jgi:superfamily I DNA/RNA helicase
MDASELTREVTRKIGYEPSKYQIGILEWVLNGKGNGACNAVAGAGKSSTLRMVAIALELLGYKPSEVRVIVFGKENSKDLAAKFGKSWKDSISTLHSCGFGILQHEIGKFGPSERVNGQKYRWIAQELGFVSSRRNPTNQLVREKAIEKPDDLYKMIDLVRLTLSQAKSKDIKQLAAHHNVEGILKPAVVAEAVREILKVGEQQAIQHAIDYTDQIWLPVKWELHKKPWFKPYKFVLCDEAQDLNAAQLELAIALAGKSGRLLFVGDPRQAIMGFAGADNRSYHKIVERTKATELPLSICYRCPRSHIDLVRFQFPQIPIEAKDSAPNGTITVVTESDLDQHLKVGDMILSRKTAPLITRCIKLIAKGVKATVKGRDIGEQIKRDLEDIGRLPGFKYTEFPTFASQYKNLKIERYIGLDNEEQLIEQLNDKLEVLTAIYKARVEATNVAELSAYIDSLFSDETSPVTLSTCHRAKGLEGDRIFILKPEDLPFTWRNQLEWQKEQEDNLLYVALTRSKEELFVVGAPDWLLQKTEEEGRRSNDTLPLELSSVDGDSKEYFAPELDLDDPDFILHTAESHLEDEYGEEDDDELTEEELYTEMDRVAEEDLLPEMAEALKARTEQLSFSSRTETVIRGDRRQTANNLQSEIAETEETLEKPTGRQWISLAEITLDAGTQSRAGMNEATIREYAQQMNDSLWQWEREPIPVMFWDGEALYPGDGHHRVMAAAIAEGSPDIYCEIREGTARDARFFSCGANRFHGLPRTNADKRNQVELLLRDEEWQKMSDRALAEHCGVSGSFVGKVRAALAESGTANISSERVDRRGRKLDTANIGAKPKEKPVLGETVEEKIAEILPEVIIEKQEKEEAKEGQISKPSGATEALAFAEPMYTEVAVRETQPPQTAQIPLPQKLEAVMAVAHSQLDLLSQKVGAKTLAEMTLSLCTVEEIREIHADLSLNLEALDGVKVAKLHSSAT